MMAESFVGQRRLIMEALDAGSGCASKLRADALSAIVVAFSDGLAMQYLADPDSVDVDAVFAVWGEMMEQASQHPVPAGSSGFESDATGLTGVHVFRLRPLTCLRLVPVCLYSRSS